MQHNLVATLANNVITLGMQLAQKGLNKPGTQDPSKNVWVLLSNNQISSTLKGFVHQINHVNYTLHVRSAG